MNNHIVVINSPKYNRDTYFRRFVEQIRQNKMHRKTPIVLLNTDYPDGLPSTLTGLGIHLVQGHGNHEDDFKRANLEGAANILILAKDEYMDDSDSLCFDLCYRMKEHGLAYRVIVECVEDENRGRMKRLGVKSVIRPIRSYPEILVRAMESPGSELIIEDMFTHDKDHFLRFPLWLEGDAWRDVVAAMMSANIGTPMACISKDGAVNINPAGEERVFGQSIIILVKTDAIPTEKQVQEAFRKFNSTGMSA
ncbi:MAG: hypothetical protein CSH37_08695 [Thalassolituus sp.]|nr:MAG: hypothetical protein CSH37_08695 [Thalassolituus sp.]